MLGEVSCACSAPAPCEGDGGDSPALTHGTRREEVVAAENPKRPMVDGFGRASSNERTTPAKQSSLLSRL